MTSKETFKTSNLNEIAFLLAIGKKYVKLENEPNSKRITFLFEADDCQEKLIAYYNKEKLISPFEFQQSLTTARDIMFNFERR